MDGDKFRGHFNNSIIGHMTLGGLEPLMQDLTPTKILISIQIEKFSNFRSLL